jgi:Lon protease-like protein
MDAILGLFPLNTVLMPGVTLRLHIFEDRYKNMIAQCIKQGAPFGVLLDRNGNETGSRLDPVSVGTTAEIRDVTRLSNGRFFIVTRGVRRFAVKKFVAQEPHWSAQVSYIDEPLGPHDVTGRLREKAVERFKDYLRLLLEVSRQELERLRLPDDPALASYLIADALRIQPAVKQELLEAASAAERLGAELSLLEHHIRGLRRRGRKPRPKPAAPFNVRFSLN